MSKDPVGHINRILEGVWQDSGTFQRLEAEPADEFGIGLWYLAQPPGGPPAQPPLSDRVEFEVAQRLVPGLQVDEIDLARVSYAALPGAQTPGRGLILGCLASYANNLGTGLWLLRPEDDPGARAEEREVILADLRAIAARQGYEAAGENPLEWREYDEVIYRFAVLTSGVISGSLLGPPEPARRRFLVLPGGRASLVEFKLRRDPRLRRALREQGWAIVKYRQIRRMLIDAGLTRVTLEPSLAHDPLEGMQQLALIK